LRHPEPASNFGFAPSAASQIVSSRGGPAANAQAAANFVRMVYNSFKRS
jgi:hypothetical protein